MKKFLSILIAVATCIVLNMSVFAEDYIQQNEDPLKIYMDELEIINEEMGTNYSIPVEYFDDSELDEVTQLFTKMSMEDFRNYVYTAHFNYISEEENINSENSKTTEESESMLTLDDFEEKKLVPTRIVEKDTFDSASTIATEDTYASNSSYTPSTQRYYYNPSNTNNYLYIETETFIINNIPRYNRSNFSYLIGSYPGYKATSCSVSFSSNDTTAAVTYTCLKMIASGLNDGKGPYPVSCTYYAGLGDLYAT